MKKQVKTEILKDKIPNAFIRIVHNSESRREFSPWKRMKLVRDKKT